jgi:penicillin-binding protein 1C
LQHVGAQRYIDTLHRLGFEGLREHPDFYGDGVALGTGAVTLYELVQAYAALANDGVFRPLTTLLHDASQRSSTRIFSPGAASLIADILADPDARALEFGRDSVLRFPVQTAVKTGTSNDFRDAWAVGFNYRHTVGVWIGNLDRQPSSGVTGSTGPALVLRGVFSELTRHERTRPLMLSAALRRQEFCLPLQEAPEPAASILNCRKREEWFLPGTGPTGLATKVADGTAQRDTARIRFRQPTEGLRLAMDPRLPPASQAFELILEGVSASDSVEWSVDGKEIRSEGNRVLWPLTRGDHRAHAFVRREGSLIATLGPVEFTVR